MTGAERVCLDLASRALDYPDDMFYANLESLEADARQALEKDTPQLGALLEFISDMRQLESRKAQQIYVATFDHDPDASLYMAWHRYGNDRGQGQALAALNGLYRTAGFEPQFGSMPDYLPRMLEFMASADEWAVEIILDGFGPEIMRLINHLEEKEALHAKLLSCAMEPLRKYWPILLVPRNSPDPTIRPMANPEPETISNSIPPFRMEE